ncbi:MAG TPA: YceD family protein [Chloroflexota bacterium]
MVSFNVSQLLLMGPGTVREYDFSEPFPDPTDELRLRGPVSGHARLMRTSEGILAHSDYHVSATVDCARCLEPATVAVEGDLDEEFLPSTDIRTGLPMAPPRGVAEDQPRINEHHEIDLNEILRQNILTHLPLRTLCDEACPGLCATCGQRLGPGHQTHSEVSEPVAAPNPSSPFARLAGLLDDDHEET